MIKRDGRVVIIEVLEGKVNYWVLDKSLPYFNVIMKRRAGVPIVVHKLPPGFAFRWFAPGDEISWAGIETSVGEFQTEAQALEYFQQRYLPNIEELTRRLVFVRASNDDVVGTVTSWWDYTGDRRDPCLHWLAVRSEYQGLGLGKALVAECLTRLAWLEGDRAIFLHTQTWSHRAIAIYLKAGFEFAPRESFAGYQNDYDQAIPLLRAVLPRLVH